MKRSAAKLLCPGFNYVSALRHLSSRKEGVDRLESGSKPTAKDEIDMSRVESKDSAGEHKGEGATEGPHTAAYEAYEDFEHRVMARIGNQNRDRFRLAFFSLLIGIIWVIAIFGQTIRKSLGSQAIEVAQEMAENEQLKIQTGELAVAVVQTILNDKEINTNAAAFLQKAAGEKETQEALIMMLNHVLKHPNSEKELTALVMRVIRSISEDKKCIADLATLFTAALAERNVLDACVNVVAALGEDPEILKVLSDLTVKVLAEQNVVDATNELFAASSERVLADEAVMHQSQAFVVDVMGDEMLQREGGNAIWKSVKHAMQPGFIRIAGFSLMVSSFAVIKIILSPF